MAQIFVKDPEAVLDYQENWATWLGSDTIATSSWVATTGITIDSDSNTTTSATVWLSSGTAGTNYSATNRIVTDGGRTNDRTIYIIVPSATLYITLAEVRQYLTIDESANDDALLYALIGAATAAIDAYTGNTFQATADSDRTLDALEDVGGRLLLFGDWLAAAPTSITNGDGTAVGSDEYVTEPRNVAPFYAARLKVSSTITWTYTTTPEDAITVTGMWAYSTTAPADVAQACLRLTAFLYRQRDTNADADRPLLAGDGTVIMPSTIPPDVKALLRPYRKLR